MDPTVAAAAIGVGGTVTVGVAGYISALKAGSAAVRAAREQRIWDQKAAIYVDTIGALNNRKNLRRAATGTGRYVWETPAGAKEMRRRYKPPDFWFIEARLAAFGSDEVHDEVGESSIASADAMTAFDKWQEMPAGGAKDTLWPRVERMLADADELDEKLIDRIRSELQTRQSRRGTS